MSPPFPLPPATHTTTTAVTAATSVTAKPDVSAKAPAKKRQRSILDFAVAAKLQKGSGLGSQAAAAAAGDVAGGSSATGLTHKSLLLTAPRFHLMVQRPEEGLLAGLWEFPGRVMSVMKTPHEHVKTRHEHVAK